MKQIFKYELKPQHQHVITMPSGAQVLRAEAQHEIVVIWALVDPVADLEVRYFSTYYTGAEMPDDPGTYVGTAQLHHGRTVIHVFERRKAS